MEKMRAAVFETGVGIVLKEVPIPIIENDDEVIAKVEAVSICGTDVHITANPPGYIAKDQTILGHEICATISEIGKGVKHLAVGDRVVVNPNNYCCNCTYCRMNLPNQCEHIEPLGIDFDGGFAKYVKLNSKVVYKISDTVDVGIASCAEPLACAISALNKVSVKPSDSAIVIGGGPIGLIVAMLLKASGVTNLYILETSTYRYEVAQGLGLGVVLNPKQDAVKERVYHDTSIGADFVFDMTGGQVTSAIDLVRKGGTVVLFGVNKRLTQEIRQSEITTKEISIIGTWLANASFPKAVSVIESNLIPLGKLITDVIALDDVVEGIGKLASGKALKVIVKP